MIFDLEKGKWFLLDDSEVEKTGRFFWPIYSAVLTAHHSERHSFIDNGMRLDGIYCG